MKMNRTLSLLFTILLATLTSAKAETFFTDDFSHGSTINGLSIPNGTPTESWTSYDFASSKNTSPSSIGPSLLRGSLSGNTTSGFWEAQALFATSPVVLTAAGDYIDMIIVFTNSAGTLLTGTHSPIWVGLYNSGAVAGTTNPPVPGNLANAGLNKTAGSAYATGNAQLWSGYVGQIYSGVGSKIITRPVQDGPETVSANQELLGDNISGGTFYNPRANVLLTGDSQTFTLETNVPYTLEFRITLDPEGSGNMVVSNALFSGVGTGGAILFSNATSTDVIVASGFDGLAFGAFNHDGSFNPRIDVSLIQVTGQSTTISTPPDITLQPVPVVVPNGGSAAFFVEAQGFNVTYQWKRFGTNLVDDGNISGATSDTLVISPASAADVASGANGYYVTVSGAGGYSVDSTTNSLTLAAGKDLTWSGPGNVWDLNSSANWQDSGGNPSTFNFGDSVTFNGATPTGITLTGDYLSASSVTVEGSGYSFGGTGSFAGPGKLIFTGDFLEIDNANTYTGGTIISNANSSALLYLMNYDGLGTGPITLAKPATMEMVLRGSGSLGIQGDIVVNDNFTFLIDGTGSFASVFFGDLSGTAGKTLTIDPADPSTTNRIRFYGKDTVCDANLVLNGNATDYAIYNGTVMAPYNSTGSQIYNGLISGNGGIVQRANGTTILKGANTYSGGTVPTTGAIGLGSDTVGNVSSGPIGTGPLYLAPELPNTTGSGQVFASGGARTIANPIQYPSATNNQTLIIGGTNNLTFTGPYTLNGNDGTGTQTIRTIQVTNTALTTLAGVISDNGQGFGLTKTGPGILALSQTETYSGPTAISAGTLLVNGQIGAGAVTVTNGTIGGSGTITGPVTVQNAGTMAPGNQGIGTLTLNGGLTLQSGSTVSVEVNKTAGTRDILTVNSVAYDGTLLATNISGSLSVGDTFTVINAASHTGNFSSVAGSPGAGLAWAFDPATGVLSVVTGVNPNPTNIAASVSGNTLNLSWPADHLGWVLQSNSVSISNPDSWFDVPGSAAGTNATINIDSSKTNVFYRLKL